MPISKAQIGRCGELFVQFKLLMCGIESSPLTTDAGVDLVALSPHTLEAVTVQVKTNAAAKPAGGKGKQFLGWRAEDKPKAKLFAFVDLETLRVWLVDASELAAIAQQHPSGSFNFFMAVDPTASARRDGKKPFDYEFAEYLFENRVAKIFGQPKAIRPHEDGDACKGRVIG